MSRINVYWHTTITKGETNILKFTTRLMIKKGLSAMKRDVIHGGKKNDKIFERLYGRVTMSNGRTRKYHSLDLESRSDSMRILKTWSDNSRRDRYDMKVIQPDSISSLKYVAL